jgi:pimeloyl-ACP methyl ester carboxylesterase
MTPGPPRVNAAYDARMTTLEAPPLPSWIAREMPFRRVLVPTAEGRIHAIDDGPPDGPVVLLLHGNPMWSYLWRKVVRELRALPDGRRFRIVAPDLLGLGLSDKPARASAHVVGRHVAAIAEVLDVLGARDVIFAGQDWGGPIGAGALRAFELRGGRVRALLLSNTSVLPIAHPMRSTPFHRFARMPVVSDLAFRLGMFPVPIMDRVQGDRSSLGWREKRAYAWPLRRLRDRAAPLGLARMVPSSSEHPSVPDIDAIGRWVTSFRGPIGLVWGMRDPILGRSLARHQRALSPAFVEETQAGHFLQEEVPALLASSILRLDALDRPPV